jgi:hypothetical protein
MRAWVALGILVATVATTVPTRADDGAPVGERPAGAVERPATSSSLDIDLRLSTSGFRFGSRLFGREGYAGGAWLNGERRRGGFSLDGRIERGGKAHDFKLDADIDEWVRRAFRWWSVTDL